MPGACRRGGCALDAATLTLCNEMRQSYRRYLMRHRRLIGVFFAALLLSGCAETPTAAGPGSGSGESAILPSTTLSTPASAAFELSPALRSTASPESDPASSNGSALTLEPTLDCADQAAMQMSLDANFVGQPSPIQAAQWFVIQPWDDGFNVSPDAVWTVTAAGEGAWFVSTDRVVLQAIRSPDNGTWNIASARRCA